MGWTYTHKPEGISAKEFLLDRSFKWSTPDDLRATVLDAAVVNLREFYAAVEFVRQGKRTVWAAVFKLDYRTAYLNFGYKDMEEDMGPALCNCPARILDLLTETTSENAKLWRARCRQHIANREAVTKIKPGDRLVFDILLKFTDGAVASEFCVERLTRTKVFVGYNSYTYQLPRSSVVSALDAGQLTIIPATKSPASRSKDLLTTPAIRESVI